MMKSNFDSIINRTNTNSLKYDFTSERERPDDILPLWVAGRYGFYRCSRNTTTII